VAASLRDWYLGALGVVRYLPRDGCAADFPGEEGETRAECPVASTPEEPSPAAPLQRPRVELPSSPAARTRQPGAPVVDAASTPPPDTELVEFRLAFWQPSPPLVVLSAMPPGARPSPRQQDMLARLLKAIDRLDGPLPAAELIDWPIARGTQGGLQGARELLATFLEVKMNQKPFAQVLLMGDIAAQVAAGDSLAVGQRLPLPCAAEAVVTHSLYAMDRDPALKRDTWEAIRFLAEGGG